MRSNKLTKLNQTNDARPRLRRIKLRTLTPSQLVAVNGGLGGFGPLPPLGSLGC